MKIITFLLAAQLGISALLGAAAAPEQLAPAPMSAKADATSKQAGPKTEAAPVAGSQTKVDPQTDLKTVIPDLVRLTRSDDVLLKIQTYTPPAIWAKIAPEYIKQYQKIVQPVLDSAARDPEMKRRRRMLTDPIAASIEALESQTPTFNAKGDEATYIMTQPVFPMTLVNGIWTMSLGPKVPVVFVKINGKWYIKQPPEIPRENPL